MSVDPTHSYSLKMQSTISILVSLFLVACGDLGDSLNQSEVPRSSAMPADQNCRNDVGTLRSLREDISKSGGSSAADGSSRSQAILQRWMRECSGSASEFDRIAVSGLWNRLGVSLASRNECGRAGEAFAHALSLLRPLPRSEEFLIALRGKAECDWTLEQRTEAIALAREQLDVARTMSDGSVPAAYYLVDALEFAARFAGMTGDQAESVQLATEAQKLRESIEAVPPNNSVPAPATR